MLHHTVMMSAPVIPYLAKAWPMRSAVAARAAHAPTFVSLSPLPDVHHWLWSVQKHVDDLTRSIVALEAQKKRDSKAYTALKEERLEAEAQRSSLEEVLLSTNAQVEALSLVRLSHPHGNCASPERT